VASWSPEVPDVSGLVQGWQHAADLAGVQPLIDQATVEVVGEVGRFDPTTVINPDAPESDWITLGDLARNAAALRAAYQWASGLAPEFAAELTPSLHARYLDALTRLRRHINGAAPGEGIPLAGSLPAPGWARVPDVPWVR
jgi:hypothetical protein